MLGKAVEMEKESIAFYAGLRAYLGDADAERLVDRITREELRHVADLGGALRDLR